MHFSTHFKIKPVSLFVFILFFYSVQALSQPFVKWQKKIDAKEIDYLNFVDKNRILVGTLDLNSLNWRPEYKELFLVDSKTGNRIWSVPRINFFMDNQKIMLTEQALLIKSTNKKDTKTKYFSMDIDTGEELWEYEAKNMISFTILNQKMNELIIVTGEKDNLYIVGQNLTKKTKNWETMLSGFNIIKKEPLKLEINENSLYISGDRIARLSLEDHKTVWNQKLPIDNSEDFNLLFLNENLFCYNQSNLAKLNINNGDLLWSLPKHKKIKHVALFEDDLIILLKDTDGKNAQYSIEKIGSKTNNSIWSIPLKDPLQSSLIRETDNLYFATNRYLYCLDYDSGHIKYSHEIPGILQAKRLQVDILKISGDTIILAKENGIAAFGKDNGELFYFHYIDGIRPYTLSYIFNKLHLNAIASAKKGKEIEETENYEISDMMKQIQFNQAQKAALYANRGFAGLSMTENRILSTHQMRGSYLTSAWETTSGMEMAQLSAAAGTAIGTAIVSQMKLTTIASRAKCNSIMADNTITTFNNALSLNYFIRPYYKNGWNFAVINLTNGTRANIPVCDPYNILSINGANLATFSFLPEEHKLVFKCYHSDKHKKEKYFQKAMYPEVDPLFSKKAELTYPFLTVIDLTGLEFKQYDNSKYEIKSISEIGDPEQELIVSIKKRETKKAMELISKGADVNVRDEYGLTPAIYTGVTDNKKLAKFLMKQGADFSVTDDNGWAPWHYAFYCNVKPKSHGILNKYYRKQSKNK